MKASGKRLSKGGMFFQVLAVVLGCAALSACCNKSLSAAKFCVFIGINDPSHPFFARPVPLAKATGRNAAGFRPRPATGQPAVPELAPFFGNLSTVALPPLATQQGMVLSGLQRQSDCSLSLIQAAYSLNGQGVPVLTPLAPTPHYEKVLATNAFLNTTPDRFPNGCVDPTLGTTSNIWQFLGQGKSGQTLMATVGATGILTGSVNPDGSYATQPSQMTDVPPLTITSADLNKDGNTDIVSVNSDGLHGSITVFLGKDDGTYQPGVNLALPNEESTYAVIDDLNNDGNLDIVVLSGSSFSIFLGKGDGTFQPVQNVSPAGSNPFFMIGFITADVNGDGKKDIVDADGEIFLGAGDGVTYTLAPTRGFPLFTGSSAAAPTIVSADFNNDKKLDVAIDDGSTIHIFLGNGDGTFKTGPAYATIGDLGFILAVDLDGDGNTDIWSGFAGKGLYGDDIDSSDAYALMGNGDGTFQGAPNLPVKYAQTNLADLNGDGRPDLVNFTTNSSNQSVLNTYLTQANGIPRLDQQLVLPAGGGNAAVLGKFVGSTNYDAFWVATTPIGPTLNLSVGNGDGSFGLPTTITAPSLVPSGIDNGEDITGVLTADINHDGKADLIYTFFDIDGSGTGMYYEGIAVQLGNGDGTFQAPKITYTLSTTTQTFDPGTSTFAGLFDVNKDNSPDVFLVVPGPIVNGTQQNTLQVFISKGDGTFKAPVTLAVTPNILETDAGYGSPLAFADLNDDGNVDLVASGSSSDGTTPMFAVAMGNGDGTFKAPTLFTVEGFGYPGGPAIADFDGDGKLDLALQGAIESGGGFFPGNGDGSFQSIANGDGTISPVDSIALAVSGGAVAADFNKDGKMDLMFGGVILLNKEGETTPVLAATSTALGSSLNPSTSGTSVTFTATVTSTTAGTITGTVTFLDGVTQIGTGTLTAGVATFATSTLTVASHSITAQYGGDTNYAGSTSPVVTQVVNAGTKATTTTTVASSQNPSASGASVTFTAMVTSATAGTITGSVMFLDGATQIGTGTLTAGVATFATSTLTAGSHSITAQYGGDANYATSTSSIVTQVVNAAGDFSVASSANSVSVTAGSTGMVALTVTPLNGSTQTVTFACSGLPAASACSFMPASVTLDGTHTGMTQVMISTTASTAKAVKTAGVVAPSGTPPGNSSPTGRMLAILTIGFAGVFGLALIRPRNAKWRMALAILALAIPVMAFVACSSAPGGSSGGGTPAGTYPVTITASSGGDAHSASVSLTVN